MAYFNALKDPTVQAAVKKMSGAIPQAITPIGAGVAPQSSNVALASGMSASNAGASKGAIPSNVTYGSNVVGFDPNNATHKALADAGQAWWDAKVKGDTAGMSAAAAKGNEIRASGGIPASYDSKAGITTFTPKAAEVHTSSSGATPQDTPKYFAPPTTTTNQIPIQAQPAIPVMDMNKIGQYVDGQLSAELTRQRSAADQAIASGRTTANQQLGAIQTQFDRTRKDMGEDRVLADLTRQRNANPYSGRTAYDNAMIGRERERSDREMSADLATRQANVNQSLADLENSINEKYAALEQTKGAERERMIQSLRQDERAYESLLRGDLRADYLANSQLRQADFGQALDTFKTNRGVYEDDRNFGYMRDQDQIRNDAQYGGVYRGSPTYAAQVDQRNYDYQQGRDKVNDAQQQWQNNYNQAQFDWNKAQQTWENTFKNRSFEQDMKDAAASRGLQWASLSQRDKEFIADQEWKEKQYQLDQTKLNQPANYDFNTDPDFGDDVAWINSNPSAALNTIKSKSNELINKYGYKGYQELLKLATGE